MCFTVLSVFCIVLCCRHWASFPRCRKSVAFLFLKPGQMERFKSHPPCKEVGIGVGVSLGSSCCKAGAQLLSPAEQRLPYSPPPPSLCTHLLSAFSLFFFQWQLLYVCKHKGPRMSFCLSSKLSCCSHFGDSPPPPSRLRVCHNVTDDCAMSYMLLNIFKKHIFHIQLDIQRKMLRCNFDL